jgi:hypothetical protein
MEHNQSNFGLDQCHNCGVRRKQVANPTTNYGFVLPTPTDLVTDLPADFDVALQGVDTRLKALQPGTTLGDLAYSSATANTNTRLGIGSTGQILTVSGGVPAWATPSSGIPNNDTSFVSGSQAVSGGSYVDLATVQSVTVTTGTKALVMFSAQYENGSSSLEAYMSFGVTGATTSAATDARASKLFTGAFAWVGTLSQAFIITGLTAGSNTFTTKYRMQGGGSMGFNNRYISVIDMGS